MFSTNVNTITLCNMQVGLYDALCAALPKLAALQHLELQGLKRAFGKGGTHGLKLSRALKPPSTTVATTAATARAATDTITGSKSSAAAAVLQLKSLVLRNVSLTDAKAVTALCCAVAASGITALSLVNCGLREGISAQMIGMIIRAHSNRYCYILHSDIVLCSLLVHLLPYEVYTVSLCVM
jgi:hypothetical protein